MCFVPAKVFISAHHLFVVVWGGFSSIPLLLNCLSQPLEARVNLEGLEKLRRYCAMRTRRAPGLATTGPESSNHGLVGGASMEEIAELLQLIRVQV